MGAGGGGVVGLPTGAHCLESEKCGNCDKLATGNKNNALTFMLLT